MESKPDENSTTSVPQPRLVDIDVKDEVVALNVIVSFVYEIGSTSTIPSLITLFEIPF
jgi:hypothetical protein